VHHPYDGTEIADVVVPDAEQTARAVAAAQRVAPLARDTSIAVLGRLATLIAGRTEEIAETVTAENGTPLRQAHAEVAGAVTACRLAAAEAGQVETHQWGTAMVRRRPRGPVVLSAVPGCPIDLLATRVAAAVAVGAPVVVAPSVRTPMAALALGELLAETGLPAFSVVPGLSAVSSTAVSTTAVSSTVVSPVQGAAVVCPDADLSVAVARLVTFGARRVIVHASVAERFVPMLVDAVRSLRTGDPHDPSVQVGPLLDESAAERVVQWVAAAGEVLTGGTRTGTRVEPTVVRSTHGDVSGPVLTVSVVDSMAAAVAAAGGDRAGVFTRDLATAVEAGGIDVAELVIGDLPAAVTRASVRAAMRECTREQVTEIRLGSV
jgi:acyl-CoA reductase-like NAD-dependent aldehyde dehydrogenase